MLHNNHIIKTLSNTILSLSLVCLIFNSINICSMAANPIKFKSLDTLQGGQDGIIPSPKRPPFNK